MNVRLSLLFLLGLTLPACCPDLEEDELEEAVDAAAARLLTPLPVPKGERVARERPPAGEAAPRGPREARQGRTRTQAPKSRAPAGGSQVPIRTLSEMDEAAVKAAEEITSETAAEELSKLKGELGVDE